MIRYGDSRSIPELKKLWKECFADEDAYIDAFFEAMYEDKSVLLEEENGVLFGASFFLPGKIWLEHTDIPQNRMPGRQELPKGRTGQDGEWQQIRYVYALAVYPQYRGRGIAARLLRSAHEIYRSPLIAEPAEDGLVGGFYRPLGFQENFYLRKKLVELPEYDVQAAEIRSYPDPGKAQRHTGQQLFGEAEPVGQQFTEAEPVGQQFGEGEPGLSGLSEAACDPVSAEEYCSIRDQYFQKHGYISWPVRHVAFALQQYSSNGGGAFAIRRDGRKDLILYFREGCKAVVVETTLSQEEAEAWFLPRMSVRCRQAIFKRMVKPEQSGRASEESFCLTGMSLGLSSVYGYLNLSLDE